MVLPTVCGEYAHSLLKYLRSQGLAESELHALLGGDPQPLLDAAPRLPLQRFEQLLDAAAAQLSDPLLGARAGAACSPKAWAILGYLGLSAASVREAILAIVQYSRLLIDLGDLELTEAGDQRVRLSWVLPASAQPSRHLTEYFFCNWYRTYHDYIERWCPQREVYFAHAAPPGAAADMAELLEAPVHYGASFNGVCFDGALLDSAPPFPHRAARESLESLARAELAKLHTPDRVLSDTRAALQRMLPDGAPPLEMVAAELGVAPRSLQRRLQQQGDSYKDLVEEVRRARARELIADARVNLLDIAAELGFSGQAAFNRAFKRWFGEAPGRYRQGLIGDSGET